MPRKSGFEVLAELRDEAEPRLADKPVVVVTHSNTPEDRVKARELGANDVLIKPLGPGPLANAIEAAGAGGPQ